MLRRELDRALALGFVPDPAADLRVCEAPDGLIRMAVVGPDYDLLVSAADRERAAAYQERVGRLTWYFICTRPRVRVVADGVDMDAKNLVLPFQLMRDDGSTKEYVWQQATPSWMDGVQVEAGGRVVRFERKGASSVPQNAALLAQHHLPAVWTALGTESFDLRVHYIGRARGKEEESCALDRLASHEKYQRVMEEVLEDEHRNRDVWLVLASGTTMHLLSGHREDTPQAHAHLKQGDERARQILTERDRVDLVEALLIHYFKPHLNVQHVNSLGLKHKVLMQCRRAKITGVMLTYNTHDLGLSLYTEAVSRQFQHSLRVPLV